MGGSWDYLLFKSSKNGWFLTMPKSVLLSPRLQLHLLEEYLVKYWDQPLDIKAMVLVSRVSARSIFRYFREVLGCSPSQFLRKIRLQRARDDLAKGERGTTVIAVALRCGFSSLGHFAREYRAAFGELPSATLNRHGLKQITKCF